MARACFRRVPPGAPRVGHPCAQPPCRPPPSRPSPRPRSRDASASVHAHRADQRVPLKTRFRAPTLPRPKAAKTPPPGNVPVEAGTWHQVEREGPHWRHVSAHGARHSRSGRETTARPGRGRPRGWGSTGRLGAGLPSLRVAQLASRLSRPAPRPPCRDPPGMDHATGRRVWGDVTRGPGGLTYPTRDRLAVEEQAVVKGRTGLVSGLPAPVSRTAMPHERRPSWPQRGDHLHQPFDSTSRPATSR